MKILVLSDTHKYMEKAAQLLNDIGDSVDAIIHLGDNVQDAEFIKRNWQLPVYNVAGNCDYYCSVPDEKLVEIGGKKIFITHGHQYNVKFNVDTLVYRGLELGADICLFGHTHIPFLQVIREIVVMNPGSISLPRGSSKHNYGIIKIENNEIYPTLVEWR